MIRAIKNWIGRRWQGKVDCPNCGDNLWWKKSDDIIGIGRGHDWSCRFSICRECLSDLAHLDQNKIIENFKKKWYWTPNQLVLAEEALENYKKGLLIFKKNNFSSDEKSKVFIYQQE